MTTRKIEIGNLTLGGDHFTLIAGPCAVESHEQLLATAKAIQEHSGSILRGGIFKLRTNPRSFQGLGAAAFEIVRRVKEETLLPFVSEISDPRQIGDLDSLVDIFQVGSRNMHNYALLKELSHVTKPVILKRGFCATVQEWLLAADYLSQNGNQKIILCERGIRTFEDSTRNTLDLSAVADLKQRTTFPILVDPSHGTGRRELVVPMSLAAAAAGADGLLVEVHPNPTEALSDGFQALDFDGFEELVSQLNRILPSLGRHLKRP